MGRPYATELDELHRTYVWALQAPVEALADAVATWTQGPLLAIGSGGSLTAAHFACFLHTQYTGKLAQVLTPYELITSPLSLDEASVLVLSARGSNPDVLACVDNVATRLPRHLTAITTAPQSPLGDRLHDLAWPTVHQFDTPTRKDGFLATNSLLATMVVLARAYALAADVPTALPETLELLVHPGLNWQDHAASLTAKVLPLVRRQTLIVLHGSAAKTTAADIESRFTEAALGSVQVADFRNFAHGRHYWLAANPDSSAVLALASPDDCQVATRTLSLIPKEIPRLLIEVDSTVPGVLASVWQSVFLAYVAATHKGVDPGRPHVPMFGRKLYHLNARPRSGSGLSISSRTQAAIERKSGYSCHTLAVRGELEWWIEHHCRFIEKLGHAQLDAIVFDYDGTLCGPHRRFEGPSDAVSAKLTALLKAGVRVGIATGRGKSVRDDLQKRIRSTELRRRVTIAYHNGAEIGTLDDLTTPPDEPPLAKTLENLADHFLAIPEMAKLVEITAKGSQITLQLSKRADTAHLFEVVSCVVRDIASPGVAVVTSTHSIDVLAPGISKLLLLGHLRKHSHVGHDESRVLCIGDRGRWPGNDADLLNHALSLSVDQVSHDPRTCWNLSTPGQRYDLACLDYLEMLNPKKHGARFDTERLRP